jgi:hypothetical protein
MIRASTRISKTDPAKLLCLCLLLPATLNAGTKNLADYPLRIHIMGRDQTTFRYHRNLDEAKGEGRANLFENSNPRGVDFSYDCSEKLQNSIAFETYPAKWKKPGKELTVLLPVFGKTGTYNSCDLKTDVKDFAYVSHNGRISPEPAAEFKAWMVKHDYDPEHGKDTPINLQPTQAAAPPL